MNREEFTVVLPKEQIDSLMDYLKKKKPFLEEQGYQLVREAEVKLVEYEVFPEKFTEVMAINCEPILASICFAFICSVVIGISWLMLVGM